MANEVNITFGIQVRNGAFNDQYLPGLIQDTQTMIGKGGQLQNFSASAESDIDFGDKAAIGGLLLLVNLDTTNYFLYGPKSSGVMVTMGKVRPGKFAWVEVPPGVIIRGISDTDDVKMDVRLY